MMLPAQTASTQAQPGEERKKVAKIFGAMLRMQK